MSNPDLALALALADEADAITARHLVGDLPGLAIKANGSPVTEVDRDVEEALALRLEDVMERVVREHGGRRVWTSPRRARSYSSS